MQLVMCDLRDRSFLLQLFTIMHEFGDVIPWLDPLRHIQYWTNAERFRDELLLRLGCADEGEIVPYQLHAGSDGNDYMGGILHFPVAPERFKDLHNCAIHARLRFEHTSFISCLQVRDMYRGDGHGARIMREALDAILAEHGGRVWGVVSDPRLVRWYEALGGRVLSPAENKDGLWIVKFGQ